MDVGQGAAADRDLGLGTGAGCAHGVGRDDVGVDGGRVREIPEACIVRIHGRHCTVVLEDGRLANLHVGELDADLDLAGWRCIGRGGSRLEQWATRLRRVHRSRAILGALDADTDGSAGGARGGAGRAREAKIRRTRNTDGARTQNRLWNLDGHEVVEGGDLVVDNLSAIVLSKVELENVPVVVHRTGGGRGRGQGVIFGLHPLEGIWKERLGAAAAAAACEKHRRQQSGSAVNVSESD